MPCGGWDLWPQFYFALILIAIGVWWWRGGRPTAVGVGVLVAQWWIFNLLHDLCFWYPLSNILADTLILLVAYWGWRHSRPNRMVAALCFALIARIFWHAAWGAFSIDGMTYAVVNNAIYMIEALIVIGFGIVAFVQAQKK